MLCDSNVLIYAADPADDRCLPFVEREDAAIASLSRIEVLGFHGLAKLSQNHLDRLHELITSMIEFDLNEKVIRQAIILRQQKKIGLADSIIAATALTQRPSVGHAKCRRLQTNCRFNGDQPVRDGITEIHGL